MKREYQRLENLARRGDTSAAAELIRIARRQGDTDAEALGHTLLFSHTRNSAALDTAFQYNEASKAAWDALWETIDTWPRDKTLKDAVKTAKRHIKSWPDELKRPPIGRAPDPESPALKLLSTKVKKLYLSLFNLSPPFRSYENPFSALKELYSDTRDQGRFLSQLFRHKGAFAPDGPYGNAAKYLSILLQGDVACSIDEALSLIRILDRQYMNKREQERHAAYWIADVDRLIESTEAHARDAFVHLLPMLNPPMAAGLAFALVRLGMIAPDDISDTALTALADWRLEEHRSWDTTSWWRLDALPQRRWAETLYRQVMLKRDRAHYFVLRAKGEWPRLFQELSPDKQATLATCFIEVLLQESTGIDPRELRALDDVAPYLLPALNPLLEHTLSSHVPADQEGNLMAWVLWKQWHVAAMSDADEQHLRSIVTVLTSPRSSYAYRYTRLHR